MKSIRVLAILLIVGTARAQVPGMYPWWEGPLAKELGLSEEQDKKIRDIVREFRPKLIQLRAQVETAEAELRDEMNESQVDVKKAAAAIDKVVEARGGLTREVSHMGLQMRLTLTATQWQELERRQPRGANRPGPPRDGRQPRPPVGGAAPSPPK
jgi:Spy/CpxP family protein refolding chaperone